MLLRQHLGRGKQRRLPPAVHDLQHRPHRDDRLAGTDLALQQPVHGVVESELIGYLSAGQLLPHGQLERQPGVVGVEQAAARARARRRRVGGGREPPLREHHLQQERLVPLQPVPGALDVGPVHRAVNPAERVGQPAQAVAVPDRARHRVLDIQDIEDDPHRAGDLPGGDLLRRRVDRDHLGGVLGGRVRGILARIEQLVFGMGELALAPEGRDLAGEQAEHPGRELPFAPVLPPPAEESEHEHPVPVGHGRLEDAAPPVAHGTAGHFCDLGLHGHVLAVGQRGEIGQLAPGLVPPRVVPHQVARGPQLQRLLQLLGRLVADHQAQRVFKDRHGRYSTYSTPITVSPSRTSAAIPAD